MANGETWLFKRVKIDKLQLDYDSEATRTAYFLFMIIPETKGGTAGFYRYGGDSATGGDGGEDNPVGSNAWMENQAK